MSLLHLSLVLGHTPDLQHPVSIAGVWYVESIASLSFADGKASVRFVEGPHNAHNWLRHDHKAVKFKQDKAPAYVVDGGVPSESCPPTPLHG